MCKVVGVTRDYHRSINWNMLNSKLSTRDVLDLLYLRIEQVPYKPNNVAVRVSTAAFVTPESPGEVPDRLDVSFGRPSLDAETQMFETSDGGKALCGLIDALHCVA